MARAILTLALAAAATLAHAAEVRILAPAAEPIFGEVRVIVEVEGDEAVEAVEIRLDGRTAGREETAPYWFVVDVGQENREHRIEARALAGGRVVGEAELRTPAFQVDDALDLELQQLYVTVTDGGERMLGLGRESFRILDRGVPQEIVTFEAGDVPFTAVLLFDTSGSMRGRHLRLALEGARTFLEGMREHDEASLMAFADRLLLETPFRGDASAFEPSLHTAEAAAGTAVRDHLYLALLRLEQRQGRRVVILLSDGWDLHSVLTPEELRSLGRRSQAIIYWVRLAERAPAGLVYLPPRTAWRSPELGAVARGKLERTIRASGGRILEIRTIEEVEASLREILAELREQYALGYYPDPTLGDGSWREVRVKLLAAGGRVRTRDGYVDR